MNSPTILKFENGIVDIPLKIIIKFHNKFHETDLKILRNGKNGRVWVDANIPQCMSLPRFDWICMIFI